MYRIENITRRLLTAALVLGFSATAEARDAFANIEAESHDNRVWVQKTRTYVTDADVLRYSDVQFGVSNSDKIEMRLAVPASRAGRRIEVRTDSATGELLGTLRTASTGSSTTYTIQSVAIKPVTGTKRIFLVFPDSDVIGRFDQFRFAKSAGTPPPPPPPPPTEPPPSAGCPTGSVMIALGSNIQSIVNAQATNATFCLAAGEHRMQSVQPKAGQKFFGAPGSIMNGSRLLTAFTMEGNLYVASGQTQQGDRIAADECAEGMPRCGYPEAFYINDQPLIHVDAKSKVTAGKYFFDYAADKIFFMDNPAGKKVETAVSPNAFGGAAANVQVHSIKIVKYASPLQRCAIQGQNGWIIQNNDVSLNHGVGVCVNGNGKVLNNKIYDNGEMGIGCNGDDILIEGNEIARNGFFSGIDVMWEGGGSKCAITNRLVVRNNYSHDNNGYGLWTDIDNANTLYEANRIENNLHAGISHEISYSAIIRNNRLVGNGRGTDVWLWGAGIQIQDSQNVEVYGNYVENSPEGGNGIAIIEQERGMGAMGQYLSANNYIHDNTIVFVASPTGGATGMIADFDPARTQAANNRFNFNKYYVAFPLNEDFFGWGDNFYTFSVLRSRFGQELQGSLVQGRP